MAAILVSAAATEDSHFRGKHRFSNRAVSQSLFLRGTFRALIYQISILEISERWKCNNSSKLPNLSKERTNQTKNNDKVEPLKKPLTLSSTVNTTTQPSSSSSKNQTQSQGSNRKVEALKANQTTFCGPSPPSFPPVHRRWTPGLTVSRNPPTPLPFSDPKLGSSNRRAPVNNESKIPIFRSKFPVAVAPQNGGNEQESHELDRIEYNYNGACLRAHSLFRFRSFLCPPRIREIWRPRLNAWLNSIRVWNSETKGNQARKATGVNRSNPITIS
nr:protein trichome birefringence-like [Ipomoea batatas]